MLINCALKINSRVESQARFAVELLFEGVGLPVRFVKDVTKADFVYAHECPPRLNRNCIWVRADQIRDWNKTEAKAAWWRELPFLYQMHPPLNRTKEENHIDGDMVYSTYAVVTGAFEQEQEKDAWDVPISKNSFLKRSGILELPLVAMYVNLLEKKIRSTHAGKRADFEPRWPDNKKYALVLSHDVDQPFLYANAGNYRRRLKTALVKKKYRLAARGSLGLLRAGLYRTLRIWPPLEKDPNLCFDKWLDFEEKINLRSCFYAAVITPLDDLGDAVDPTYDFNSPLMKKNFRQLIERGWEMGLHASINAREETARLKDEKEKLEGALPGYKIKGIRHHYWALDGKVPERTLGMHAAAGFLYDSSLGLNDFPGFRRGMAWPFQPFDREKEQVVPILEIPPTIMDGSVIDDHADVILKCIKKTFAYNGCAVLDWHQEQLNPSRLNGIGPVLLEILEKLSGDKNIYWVSPAELADWWQKRKQRLIKK